MTLRLDPTYRYSGVHIRVLTTFRSQLSGKRLIDGKNDIRLFFIVMLLILGVSKLV